MKQVEMSRRFITFHDGIDSSKSHRWKAINEKTSYSYWDKLENRRNFMDKLQKTLNILDCEQWSKVKVTDVIKKGGAMLLSRYGNSLQRALLDLYPNKPWKFWTFDRVARGFWDNYENVTEYLGWLEKKLFICSPEEWYEVGRNHLIHFGAKYLMFRKGEQGYDRLVQLLSRRYPSFSWDKRKFKAVTIAKTQKLLFRILKSSIPSNYRILMNTRLPLNSSFEGEPALKSFNVDIFIPSLSLAIEYHGIQHYQSTSFYGSHEKQQIIDESKRILCRSIGISLIEIGYWWDYEQNTLLNTIYKHRPDIFQENLDGSSLDKTSLLPMHSYEVFMKEKK